MRTNRRTGCRPVECRDAGPRYETQGWGYILWKTAYRNEKRESPVDGSKGRAIEPFPFTFGDSRNPMIDRRGLTWTHSTSYIGERMM